MNYGSCGAPATTIPSVFHPREKGIFAANSGNSHRNSANAHFWPLNHAPSHYTSSRPVPFLENALCK